ncbi:site-2 protease family protein [Phenylobacterium sp.]|uniref:site-2 protease family protein n=1 Tax=Phenylobacterium sp. TaxID=1871053 RepID=UPI002F3E753A
MKDVAGPPPQEPPEVAARAGPVASPLAGPGIVVVWISLGAALVRFPRGLLVFAFVMVGWILSVMAHEFSHAAVAWLGGDRTVAEKGYLSFDPRRYGDLGVSLVIPLIALAMGGIGFPGGAVYLRNDLMRGPLWRAAAALAGPAATLVVLLVLARGLSSWQAGGVVGQGSTALFAALTMLAFLQATALILNLLPIPGLDGFGAIRPFLPARLMPQLRKVEGLAMVALLLLIFWVPGASGLLLRTAASLSATLGLDLGALQAGWAAFHFWRPA